MADYKIIRWAVVRVLGFSWGLGGILAMLCFAIYRLAPMAYELSGVSLTLIQWGALLFSIIFMAYSEGYKGFHNGFAPRVVARANYLKDNPLPLTTLLAPLFCMGFIYATRKRMIVSTALTLMIIFFVVVVRMFPQPWRGIIDAGVVVGLFMGVCSIVYYATRSLVNPGSFAHSPEVPGSPPVSH